MHVIHVLPSLSTRSVLPQFRTLESAGHVVRPWRRAAAALVGLAAESAIVVDALASPADAHAYCHDLRRLGTRAPVLLLTRATDLAALPRGLPVDDFLLADSSAAELLARLHLATATRRRPHTSAVHAVGDLVLDDHRLSVAHRGRVTALTHLEHRVLRLFFDNPDAVLTRERILAEAWGDPDLSSRVVDTFVCRIRRKLGPAGNRLLTVRNVGYRLTDRRAPSRAA